MAGGSLTDVYHEVCEHIRATDDISLKLLAAVPLATGVGITLLIRSPTEAAVLDRHRQLACSERLPLDQVTGLPDHLRV